MLFWILVIVVLLIFGALFFRFFRSFWKAFFAAIGIVSFILCILGVLSVVDARDFAEKMQGSPTLYLLEENSRMLAGVNDLSKQDKDVKKTLTDDEFSYYSALYGEKDNKELLGNKYKLFILNMNVFEHLTDEDFEEYEGFTRESVFRTLKSENAVETYINHTLGITDTSIEHQQLLREKISEEAPGEGELRSNLFMVLLSASTKNQGPLFILKEYRKGNVEVYPETMFFKTLKVMPLSMINEIEDIAMQRAKKE